MENNKSLWAINLAAALLLAGCGTQSAIQKTSTTISENQVAAEKLSSGMKQQAQTAAVLRHKYPRLAGTEVRLKEDANKCPALVYKPFPYRSGVRDLDGVISDISRGTGLTIRRQSKEQVGTNQQNVNQQTPNLANASAGRIWAGNLDGFLNQLARENELFWRCEKAGTEIVFFKEETRTFEVSLPGGSRQINASISLAGAGGSNSGNSATGGSGTSSGSGNVSITSTNQVNAFEAVLAGVKGFLQQEQRGQPNTGNANSTSNLVSNEGLGFITVTATPPTLDKIGTFIQGVNQRFARNIYIGVRMYSLTSNDEAVNGAAIRAAIGNIAGTRDVTVTPSGFSTPNSGSASQFIMKLANAGSSVDMTLQALKTLGDAAQMQGTSIIAANGQPAPFQVADDVNFIESIKTTVVPQVGVSTETVSATRTVGLTGNFLPRFLSDNRILLSYELNLTSMTLAEQRTGNNVVQIPRVARQATQQQAYMDDGESLVLFGYEQSKSTTDKSAGFLTTSNRGSNSRNILVIILDVFGDAKSKQLKDIPNV